MEKQILDLLVKMDDRLQRIEENLDRVDKTVNRIETSQTDDVIGLLKVQNKKVNFEVDYLNNRLTEMDKRLFNLEKRIEN